MSQNPKTATSREYAGGADPAKKNERGKKMDEKTADYMEKRLDKFRELQSRIRRCKIAIAEAQKTLEKNEFVLVEIENAQVCLTGDEAKDFLELFQKVVDRLQKELAEL